MPRTFDSLDRAIAAIDALAQANTELFNLLRQHSGQSFRSGRLVVSGDVLSLTCLGFEVSCKSKMVAHDGVPEANEYVFNALVGEAEEFVVALYLKTDEALRSGFEHGPEVCKITNSYVAERLLDSVAIALLRSAVFRARKVD